MVVWMMGVLHSYTMEASFGGASEGPRAGTHYNIHDFQSMGRQFCETLFEYFDPQPIKVCSGEPKCRVRCAVGSRGSLPLLSVPTPLPSLRSLGGAGNIREEEIGVGSVWRS